MRFEKVSYEAFNHDMIRNGFDPQDIADAYNDIYLTHMSPYKSFYDEFCDYIKNVKAWMPLPEPYKGEKE